MARSRRLRRGTRAKRIGKATFSTAVMLGLRLKDWKIKPTERRRQTARAVSSSDSSGCSPMRILPLVGRASPPMRCSRVLFPDPDGPMTTQNVFALIFRSTPARACTATRPIWYVLRSSDMVMNGDETAFDSFIRRLEEGANDGQA